MSFLDENDGTVTTDNSAEAEKLSKKGVNVKLVNKMMQEANAFLAAADAARDAGKKEFEFPKGSGKMHKVTLKRDLDLEEGKLSTALGGVAFLAGLLLMGKINSSDPVIQRLQAEYELAEPAQQDSIKNLMAKRLLFLDTGKADASTPMNETSHYNPPEWTIFEPTRGTKGRYRSAVGDYKTLDQKYGDPGSIKKDLKNTGKKLVKYAKKNQLWDKLLAKATDTEYNTPFTDFIEDYQEKIKDPNKGGELKKFAKKVSNIGNMSQSEFTAFIRELKSTGYDKTEIKKLEDAYKKAQKDKANKNKKTVKEDKQIKVDANQKFVIDLKHLMQKHGKEDTIKITKKLMKQLHDKGEVEINGTKVMFKEADTQLALPEPPKQTANFLGDDNMDYEGGMAKSQMLKMKNYAKALCDMIDDETQLESWVQAKLTKASDYMSSVYHYLDYQQTKNLRETIDPKDIKWEDIEPDVENRPDYKEGTIFGYTSDGRQVQAYGSYTEFDGYQVIDDIELV